MRDLFQKVFPIWCPPLKGIHLWYGRCMSTEGSRTQAKDPNELELNPVSVA